MSFVELLICGYVQQVNSGGYNDDTWFSAVRICLHFLKLNSSVEYHTKNVT